MLVGFGPLCDTVRGDSRYHGNGGASGVIAESEVWLIKGLITRTGLALGCELVGLYYRSPACGEADVQ